MRSDRNDHRITPRTANGHMRSSTTQEWLSLERVVMQHFARGHVNRVDAFQPEASITSTTHCCLQTTEQHSCVIQIKCHPHSVRFSWGRFYKTFSPGGVSTCGCEPAVEFWHQLFLHRFCWTRTSWPVRWFSSGRVCVRHFATQTDVKVHCTRNSERLHVSLCEISLFIHDLIDLFETLLDCSLEIWDPWVILCTEQCITCSTHTHTQYQLV